VLTKQPYKTTETVYPGASAFTIIAEVEALALPQADRYVPIKTQELWNSLERFTKVDHKASGWIYNAKLARSLVQISNSDTEKILDFLTRGTPERKIK